MKALREAMKDVSAALADGGTRPGALRVLSDEAARWALLALRARRARQVENGSGGAARAAVQRLCEGLANGERRFYEGEMLVAGREFYDAFLAAPIVNVSEEPLTETEVRCIEAGVPDAGRYADVLARLYETLRGIVGAPLNETPADRRRMSGEIAAFKEAVKDEMDGYADDGGRPGFFKSCVKFTGRREKGGADDGCDGSKGEVRHSLGPGWERRTEEAFNALNGMVKDSLARIGESSAGS